MRVLDRFFTYAKSKPGVWFARKDEIADWAMKTRDQTPYLDRGPVRRQVCPAQRSKCLTGPQRLDNYDRRNGAGVPPWPAGATRMANGLPVTGHKYARGAGFGVSNRASVHLDHGAA